jgi:hypothetical protein
MLFYYLQVNFMCSVKNQKNEKPGNPCSFGRQVQNSARDVKSGKFGHSDGSPPWRPAAVDTILLQESGKLNG